jgi:hypothetical protein
MLKTVTHLASRIMFVLLLTILSHSQLYGGVIVAGTDTPPYSVADFTIHIDHPFFPGGFTETVSLSSGAFSIVRQQQQGLGDGTPASYIDTEILGLTLTGVSGNVGPLTVRIGADNGVQLGPTLGQVSNVLTTTPGSPALVGPADFVSGHSSFYVLFEVDAAGMTFYNRIAHELSADITALPPFGSVHTPPGTVDLYLRLGAFNSLTDPLVGFAGGTHTVVPEPASFMILGLGFIGFGMFYRKRLRGSLKCETLAPCTPL